MTPLLLNCYFIDSPLYHGEEVRGFAERKGVFSIQNFFGGNFWNLTLKEKDEHELGKKNLQSKISNWIVFPEEKS